MSGGDRGAVFAPRHSRWYVRIKKRLMEISGTEVFVDKRSLQHKALEYIADGNLLALVRRPCVVRIGLVLVNSTIDR